MMQAFCDTGIFQIPGAGHNDLLDRAIKSYMGALEKFIPEASRWIPEAAQT
jgi:hypothetical protein